MSITEKYVAFILDSLKDSHKTQLMEPEGNGKYISWKCGTVVYLDVKLEVAATYTRSVKLNLIFDKYVVEQLFFMPLNSSPDSIMSKIYSKINAIVNKTLIDDNRDEDIKELYKKRRERIQIKLESIRKINE
jgi:hypothetical protein